MQPITYYFKGQVPAKLLCGAISCAFAHVLGHSNRTIEELNTDLSDITQIIESFYDGEFPHKPKNANIARTDGRQVVEDDKLVTRISRFGIPTYKVSNVVYNNNDFFEITACGDYKDKDKDKDKEAKLMDYIREKFEQQTANVHIKITGYGDNFKVDCVKTPEGKFVVFNQSNGGYTEFNNLEEMLRNFHEQLAPLLPHINNFSMETSITYQKNNQLVNSHLLLQYLTDFFDKVEAQALNGVSIELANSVHNVVCGINGNGRYYLADPLGVYKEFDNKAEMLQQIIEQIKYFTQEKIEPEFVFWLPSFNTCKTLEEVDVLQQKLTAIVQYLPLYYNMEHKPDKDFTNRNQGDAIQKINRVAAHQKLLINKKPSVETLLANNSVINDENRNSIKNALEALFLAKPAAGFIDHFFLEAINNNGITNEVEINDFILNNLLELNHLTEITKDNGDIEEKISIVSKLSKYHALSPEAINAVAMLINKNVFNQSSLNAIIQIFSINKNYLTENNINIIIKLYSSKILSSAIIKMIFQGLSQEQLNDKNVAIFIEFAQNLNTLKVVPAKDTLDMFIDIINKNPNAINGLENIATILQILKAEGLSLNDQDLLYVVFNLGWNPNPIILDDIRYFFTTIDQEQRPNRNHILTDINLHLRRSQSVESSPQQAQVEPPTQPLQTVTAIESVAADKTLPPAVTTTVTSQQAPVAKGSDDAEAITMPQVTEHLVSPIIKEKKHLSAITPSVVNQKLPPIQEKKVTIVSQQTPTSTLTPAVVTVLPLIINQSPSRSKPQNLPSTKPGDEILYEKLRDGDTLLANVKRSLTTDNIEKLKKWCSDILIFIPDVKQNEKLKAKISNLKERLDGYTTIDSTMYFFTTKIKGIESILSGLAKILVFLRKKVENSKLKTHYRNEIYCQPPIFTDHK